MRNSILFPSGTVPRSGRGQAPDQVEGMLSIKSEANSLAVPRGDFIYSHRKKHPLFRMSHAIDLKYNKYYRGWKSFF
jgi:hypothetical protein